MVIWELDYGGEGDFFATKAEADHANRFYRKSGDDGHVVRHEIKGGRKALVAFLNHQFGAGYGTRNRDWGS